MFAAGKCEFGVGAAGKTGDPDRITDCLQKCDKGNADVKQFSDEELAAYNRARTDWQKSKALADLVKKEGDRSQKKWWLRGVCVDKKSGEPRRFSIPEGSLGKFPFKGNKKVEPSKLPPPPPQEKDLWADMPMWAKILSIAATVVPVAYWQRQRIADYFKKEPVKKEPVKKEPARLPAALDSIKSEVMKRIELGRIALTLSDHWEPTAKTNKGKPLTPAEKIDLALRIARGDADAIEGLEITREQPEYPVMEISHEGKHVLSIDLNRLDPEDDDKAFKELKEKVEKANIKEFNELPEAAREVALNKIFMGKDPEIADLDVKIRDAEPVIMMKKPDGTIVEIAVDEEAFHPQAEEALAGRYDYLKGMVEGLLKQDKEFAQEVKAKGLNVESLTIKALLHRELTLRFGRKDAFASFMLKRILKEGDFEVGPIDDLIDDLEEEKVEEEKAPSSEPPAVESKISDAPKAHKFRSLVSRVMSRVWSRIKRSPRADDYFRQAMHRDQYADDYPEQREFNQRGYAPPPRPPRRPAPRKDAKKLSSTEDAEKKTYSRKVTVPGGGIASVALIDRINELLPELDEAERDWIDEDAKKHLAEFIKSSMSLRKDSTYWKDGKLTKEGLEKAIELFSEEEAAESSEPPPSSKPGAEFLRARIVDWIPVIEGMPDRAGEKMKDKIHYPDYQDRIIEKILSNPEEYPSVYEIDINDLTVAMSQVEVDLEKAREFRNQILAKAPADWKDWFTEDQERLELALEKVMNKRLANNGFVHDPKVMDAEITQTEVEDALRLVSEEYAKDTNGEEKADSVPPSDGKDKVDSTPPPSDDGVDADQKLRKSVEDLRLNIVDGNPWKELLQDSKNLDMVLEILRQDTFRFDPALVRDGKVTEAGLTKAIEVLTKQTQEDHAKVQPETEEKGEALLVGDALQQHVNNMISNGGSFTAKQKDFIRNNMTAVLREIEKGQQSPDFRKKFMRNGKITSFGLKRIIDDMRKGGPKGPDGPKGPSGPKGPRDPKGSSDGAAAMPLEEPEPETTRMPEPEPPTELRPEPEPPTRVVLEPEPPTELRPEPEPPTRARAVSEPEPPTQVRPEPKGETFLSESAIISQVVEIIQTGEGLTAEQRAYFRANLMDVADEIKRRQHDPDFRKDCINRKGEIKPFGLRRLYHEKIREAQKRARAARTTPQKTAVAPTPSDAMPTEPQPPAPPPPPSLDGSLADLQQIEEERVAAEERGADDGVMEVDSKLDELRLDTNPPPRPQPELFGPEGPSKKTFVSEGAPGPARTAPPVSVPVVSARSESAQAPAGPTEPDALIAAEQQRLAGAAVMVSGATADPAMAAADTLIGSAVQAGNGDIVDLPAPKAPPPPLRGNARPKGAPPLPPDARRKGPPPPGAARGERREGGRRPLPKPRPAAARRAQQQSEAEARRPQSQGDARKPATEAEARRREGSPKSRREISRKRGK